jgi:uncharacterized RDD family membrane protein YckC
MDDAHDQEHGQHDGAAVGAGVPQYESPSPAAMPPTTTYMGAGHPVGPPPGYDMGLLPREQRPLPPHIGPEWRLAGVGRRAAGAILDRVVAAVVSVVCALAWILPLNSVAVHRIDAEGLRGIAARDLSGTYAYGAMIAALISVVAYLLISTWWLGRTGATPGKAMVGIRVQRFSERGTLGFGRALLRGIVTNVFALGSILTVWLPYASVAWDPRRLLRGWHDLAVDDIVLERRPGMSASS